MKANSRRRVLISSMAMLLVALVALSTATYAWFTNNTSAYADGIHLRTTKVSELLISSKNVDWGTHVAYNAGTPAAKQLFMPTSTADGVNWFSASALAGSSYEAETAAKVTETIPDNLNYNNFYFADQLNIKNGGQIKATNVTITIEGLEGSYTRVAVVPVADKGAAPTADAFKTAVFDVNGAKYNAVKGEDLKSAANLVEITPKNTSYVIDVGDINPDTAVYYNVYVWFEGQDVDCKNVNSGQQLPNLKFTVEGDSQADA